MDYFLQPTLQHVSLAKIAIELWNQNDCFTLKNESKEELEAKVSAKVENLPLPNPLKEKLKYYIKLIGSQIFEWFEYLTNYCRLVRGNPREVRWTTIGTIDKVRSVKVLLTDLSLSLEKRYRLACTHCLEEEIEELWKEMTEEEKLQEKKWCRSHTAANLLVRLVPQYWTNCIIGKSVYWGSFGPEPTDASSNFYGCHRAVSSFNQTAIQYFFEKLRPEEKELILNDFRRKLVWNSCMDLKETMRFLLPRITENQLAAILRRHSEAVLSSFLVWPYQCFFLDAANRTWDFLENLEIYELLIEIIGKIVVYGGEYRDIFREFWRSSPEKFKRYVVRPNCSRWRENCDCFEGHGSKGQACRMFSSKMNDKEKQLMLLIRGKREHSCDYEHLLGEKKWKFFKIFVQECRPLKETMDQFERIVDELGCNDN